MSNTRYTVTQPSGEPFSTKLLYVTKSKYEGDWQSILHSHYFAEFFYVLSGRGKFVVENETFDVGPDDLVIVNPNIQHTELSFDAAPLEYIVLGVEQLAFDFVAANEDRSYSVVNYRANQSRILTYLQALLDEVENRRQSHDIVCRDLLEVLIINIVRTSGLVTMPAVTQKTSKECSLVKRYIDSNFGDDISLDILAARTHLNKFYLIHAFTKAYGISPINYLISKRISAAKELLESTDHSISQIAQIVGFSSQSYFSQSFKRLVEETPAQYRKRMRQK